MCTKYLQMMHRKRPFLGRLLRSQHRGRAEQHPYPAHCSCPQKVSFSPFGLGVLDKLGFPFGRNPHCPPGLCLDVAIVVSSRSACMWQVAEDEELCTTIAHLYLTIINHKCFFAQIEALVVRGISNFIAQQTHIRGILRARWLQQAFLPCRDCRLRNIPTPNLPIVRCAQNKKRPTRPRIISPVG